MANWQSTIDLAEIWEARRREEISMEQAAQRVAVEIRASSAWRKFGGEDSELDEIAQNFADCGDDVGEFDSYLADLYDWADVALDSKWNGKKRCWVNTFRTAASSARAVLEVLGGKP